MAKGNAPKVKASQATSAFSGVNQYNYTNSGFGSSTSQKKNGAISTTNTLSPGLEGIRQQAEAGFGSSLGQVNMTPEEQLARVTSGNDSFYNMQAEINRRQVEQAQQQAQVRYGAAGLDNSTAYGGFQGQIANEGVLTDLQTRQAALGYQQQNALASGAFNAQTLDQLNNYLQQPGQTTNSNIMQGFQNLDQVAMFNAQQQQQASQTNAQLQQQAQQQKSAMWGNILKAGIGLATIPFTGGLGLAGGLGGFGALAGGGAASYGSALAGLGKYTASSLAKSY